jgi:hypothetical protein
MNIDRLLPEELQQKAQPPIPLRPLDAPKPSLVNPIAVFDVRTPEQIKKQIKLAEETAKFFKSHWLFFYITLLIGLYRSYKTAQTNAAIMRIDKQIKGNKDD